MQYVPTSSEEVFFVTEHKDDVDYYNYREPEPPRISDVVTLHREQIRTKKVVIACNCNLANITTEALKVLCDVPVVDFSGCTGLTVPTLQALLKSPRVQLVGLLGVHNIRTLPHLLDPAEFELFRAKAVWLPNYELPTEMGVRNHKLFQRIIQQSFCN